MYNFQLSPDHYFVFSVEQYLQDQLKRMFDCWQVLFRKEEKTEYSIGTSENNIYIKLLSDAEKNLYLESKDFLEKFKIEVSQIMTQIAGEYLGHNFDLKLEFQHYENNTCVLEKGIPDTSLFFINLYEDYSGFSFFETKNTWTPFRLSENKKLGIFGLQGQLFTENQHKALWYKDQVIDSGSRNIIRLYISLKDYPTYAIHKAGKPDFAFKNYLNYTVSYKDLKLRF